MNEIFCSRCEANKNPMAHLDAAKRAIDIANRYLTDVLDANALQDDRERWKRVAEHCKTLCCSMISLMEEVAK